MSAANQRVIYLDNAATSWPKPECVPAAMTFYLRQVGASPGRSGHRLALEAERIRFQARENVARLFGVSDPLRVIFTLNATAAINLVLHGLLTAGTHVVATSLEHNAVMRPLRALQARNVSISLVPGRPDGTLDPEAVQAALRPETRLVVVTHASNVCGTILPVRQIGAIAAARGVPLLVDAAQTGGCVPIDLHADNIDLLAFSGHKSLLGPPGTGGLVLREDFDVGRLPALVQGGTGSRSESEVHPEVLPDKYEAGTANIVGLAGLAAAVEEVLRHGVDAIRAHEQALTGQLIAGLRALDGVEVIGTQDAAQQVAVVCFNLPAAAGWTAALVAERLDEDHGILCRPGLHCAPLAHRTLGTFPGGSVRLSPGLFTTPADIECALAAVSDLLRRGPRG